MDDKRFPTDEELTVILSRLGISDAGCEQFRDGEEAATRKTVLMYYWNGMAFVMPFPASSVHQAE